MTTVAPDAPATDRPILGTADAVDAAAKHPVLVIGSAPPHGRDLDLVAMPADYMAISRRIEELGHTRRRSSWARFDPDGVSAVDLFSTHELHLAGEVSQLFEDAVPVPGYRRFVLPAPHVVLLLAARGLVVRRGRLTAKARRRVERALHDDTGAWSRAEDAAIDLGLKGPLRLLRRTVGSSASPSPIARARGLAAVVVAPDPVATETAQFTAALPRRVLLRWCRCPGRTELARALRSRSYGLLSVTSVWPPKRNGRPHRPDGFRVSALLYGDFVPANLIVTSSGHIVGIDPVCKRPGYPRVSPLAFWRPSCRTPSSYPALHFRRYAALEGNGRRRPRGMVRTAGAFHVAWDPADACLVITVAAQTGADETS
jgi:hypothetical protein